MKIEYRFSHQGRAVVLGEDDLRRPFLMDPFTEHPHLTLLDYFLSVERFVLQGQGQFLLDILRPLLKRSVRLDEIHQMVILSEKHGAFHHVCRVELILEADSIPLALYAAVTEKGRRSLARECETLDRLNQSFSFSYLPAVYARDEWVGSPVHPDTKMLLVLAQWLEGYHEWHFHPVAGPERYALCIWDLEEGYRYASAQERSEIFKQAARILTLYYDVAGSCRIHPWSNAAGDFVVKRTDAGLDVKLSSARDYGPILKFDGADRFRPLIAFVYFLLDLTINMRLDRCEGTEKVVWAEKQDLAATIKGITEGMALKDEAQKELLGPARDPLALLRGFAPEELLKLYTHLKEAYAHLDPETLAVISDNIQTHCAELCDVVGEIS